MSPELEEHVLDVEDHALDVHEHALDVEKVSRLLDELDQRLSHLDAQLVGERRKHQLLGTIVGSLEELDAAGGAELFFDPETSRDQQLQKLRENIAAFEKKVAEIEARRDQVFTEIDVETDNLRRLNTELVEIEEELEDRRHELPVYRDPAEIPYRPLVMPWATNGEDDRRYRKVFLGSVAISFVMGAAVLMFKPTHEKRQEEFIPERLAELIVKKKEEPKKPEAKPQERPQDKPQDKPPPERAPVAKATNPHPAPQVPADNAPPTTTARDHTPQPAPGTPDAQQVARASAQTKGVLAHQNDLAGLIDSSGPVKVGAEGVVSNTGKIAPGTATTRSLIVSQVGKGSGGINVAAISRDGNGGGGTGGAGTGTGGGGGGNGFGGSGLGGGGGVNVARVQSATGTAAADARPLSKGAAPSRTDEEIQIVFDRYKAALYRIYNRELRNDPSLKGKMVLQLTIEPDGRVSACSVKSTDLNSPALSGEVVDRVLKFNFGAKEGVPSLTIVYPIDFLPAA
ncbi:AgmX/PglI C-terminal domain-containing protein [uncultured Piscinibacter sp.]|uniref:AgmX/PglI C-terminal domain-containing protein n=1 Tax=uncultured Piscinibacter sp. TaxID=1131835 RepID=UPI00262F5996|nr:AgmX/PglI C-terminal domain-containing protein [uncultured Piscinibacter sp.]